MPLTAAFVANPLAFATTRPIGVDERDIAGVKPAAGVGQNQVLGSVNYIFDWSMVPFGGTEALLTIHRDTLVGRQRAYFLPWEANAAITMDVGGAANYFFTSTLTGCSVRAQAKPNGMVTLTHANAKAAYGAVFTPSSTKTGVDLDELQQADRMATAAAIGNMNAMMPPVGGGLSRTVTKRDYAAKVTDGHLRTARRRINPGNGERVKTLNAAITSGKPEVSAFVYGIRNVANNTWSFWLQSTVQVTGQLERGVLHKKTRLIYGQSVVLGAPVQFYP